VTRTLAVFRQRFQGLVDQSHVHFGDVQTEQTKFTGRAAADAVQKLQRLTDDVVVVLVALRPQVVLPAHRSAMTNTTHPHHQLNSFIF